jgi:hypothetical protein
MIDVVEADGDEVADSPDGGAEAHPLRRGGQGHGIDLAQLVETCR